APDRRSRSHRAAAPARPDASSRPRFDASGAHNEILLCDDIRREGAGGSEQGLAGRQITNERGGALRVQLAEDIVEEQYRCRARELAHDDVTGETQRQRERPLFALRCLIARVEPVDHQMQLIAVWTDQREPTIDLSAPT